MSDDKILKELESIKKLIILLLKKHEATNVEIGEVLGLTEGAIRNILSGNKKENRSEKDA